MPDGRLRRRRARQVRAPDRGGAEACRRCTTAVAHPCDAVSLEGAVEAARLGLIDAHPGRPGGAHPRRLPHAPASTSRRFEIVDAEHSHDSAAKAVELVARGRAEALMKGSLHTDELMGAVVARETGIRTARRISHCFVMDVPGHAEPLIITDAAVNIAPTLEDKVDIVQNAIDLAHALGCRGGARGDPERHGDGQPQGAVDDRGGRAVQDGRPRPDHRRRCSTGRWRSTTRSASRPPRSRTSSRRSPAGPTCWSCPISRPATCWPRACRSWPARMPPASCWAPACRSS